MPFKQILQSGFLRDNFRLLSGSVFSQVIAIIFIPIIGKLFSPQDFGDFSLVMATISIIVIISTLQLERAILIAESNAEAIYIISLILISSVFISVIYLLISSILVELGIESKTISILFKYRNVIPVIVLSLTTLSCYNEWSFRCSNYFNVNVSKISSSLFINVSKLFFGYYLITNSGLIYGEFFGRLIYLFLIIYYMIYKNLNYFKKVNLKGLVRVSKRYRNIIKHSTLSAIINSIGGQFPIFLLSIYYSKEDLGFFVMSLSVLSVPASLVSNSIKDTFRKKIFELSNSQMSYEWFFRKILTYLVVFLLLLFPVLYICLPHIFELILGKRWILSGHYSQLMLPMIMFSFLANSLSSVVVIAQQTIWDLKIQLVYLISTVLFLIYSVVTHQEFETAILIFSLGRILSYLFEIAVNYRCVILNSKL